jgi:demethylmenaquinone methyltransferase/2-methoxy-6-polyprenyl-1,4-benzoquinol methylase
MNAKSEQRQMKSFFNGIAADWTDNPAKCAMRDRIVELMRIPAHSLIADIGCGKGVMLPHLLNTNPRALVAIDLAGEMLIPAIRACDDERVSFYNGDFLQAPFSGFDVCVLYNCYPHFLDKAVLRNKLAECLAPGGLVIIAHSCGRSKINAGHSGAEVSPISAPLRAAKYEANEFALHFDIDYIEDCDELFLIRLIRK